MRLLIWVEYISAHKTMVNNNSGEKESHFEQKISFEDLRLFKTLVSKFELEKRH